MSDILDAGGVVAPAEPLGAVIEPDQVRTPAPLGNQTPVAEKPEPAAKPEAPKTASEAIKRAQEQVNAKEAAKATEKPGEKPVAEAKPVENAQPRGDKGQFAPRQAQEGQQQPAPQKPAPQKPVDASPHREAPARFSPDAKAAWETAPEPVKAEVHRAIRELEAGHQKYRVDAENYERVRQYDDLARKNGGDLAKSLEKVVDFENTFSRDPIEGFQKVADHFGISLRAVAAHILNQPQDQVQASHDQTVASLKQEIASLKESLTGIAPIVQEYKKTSDERVLSEWAADKPHFNMLRSEVTTLVSQGYSPDDAYQQAVYDFQEKAASFGLSPSQAASSAPEPQQPRPLNPAGQKSIAGAPANGSNPSARKTPPPSIREALRRASAQVG